MYINVHLVHLSSDIESVDLSLMVTRGGEALTPNYTEARKI